MWALTLDYSDNSAGWLEVRQEAGYLDADLLWRWGSVEPVGSTMIADGNLLLVQGHDMVKKIEGKPDRKLHPVQWFEVTMEGEDHIEGVANFPHGNGLGVERVSFSWELVEKGAVSGWKVVDGVMVNNPEQKRGEAHIHYGNLRTTATFEDFNLKLEVNVPAGSNSGVYLRGIYEVQVMDSYGKELDPHNMGALYSRITPSEAAEKPAGEWQSMDITLYKRHLTVILNGKTVIDNQPVKGVTGGALTSDQFVPGPILLQGDHGKVSYRNLVLTPVVK